MTENRRIDILERENKRLVKANTELLKELEKFRQMALDGAETNIKLAKRVKSLEQEIERAETILEEMKGVKLNDFI